MPITASKRPNQQKLITFDPEKEKPVYCGDVIKGVFYRHVDPQHFMRKVQGYGIQELAFKELEEENIKKIMIVQNDTGKSYESDVQTWLDHGKVANYGHGKQRFLGVKYMK